MRALAIEFFWPVALFCSAPMELGFGSSLLVRFQAGRCPEIDNVVTAALLPPQPDQLRPRHDRHDNAASARHRWTCRQRNGTKPKFFNDFSRARARVRARGGAIGSWPWLGAWASCFFCAASLQRRCGKTENVPRCSGLSKNALS